MNGKGNDRKEEVVLYIEIFLYYFKEQVQLVDKKTMVITIAKSILFVSLNFEISL